MLKQVYVIRSMSGQELLDAGFDLFEEHRDELTTNKELMVLDPFLEGYSALDEAGSLFILGAFGIGGDLIGYSVNIVATNLHYRGVLMCQNDLLFVTADHRGSTVGARLIRDTKAEAKARGCNLMLWHAKPGTDLDALMERRGVKVQDIIYSEVF